MDIKHDIDKEMLTAQYIVLRRINDCLALILQEMNPGLADSMMNLHERGLFLTPEPRYTVIENE